MITFAGFPPTTALAVSLYKRTSRRARSLTSSGSAGLYHCPANIFSFSVFIESVQHFMHSFQNSME
ncbi:hypothetical protein B23_1943 [Geobacillus thermoleovorans B23]|nr:hypothetical protein B23_1943 [Geobacillus thermoleovorans B23]